MFQIFLFQTIVLLIPNQLAKHFWPYSAFVSGVRVDYLSPTLYLNDLLILLFIVYSLLTYWPRWKKFFLKHKIKIFILILILFINIIFSINKYTATYYWIRFIEFVMFAIAIYVNERIKIYHVHTPLFVALLYSFILAIWQFINKSTVGGLFYFFGERSFNIYTPGIALFYLFENQFMRAYASFAHPNSLAAFAGVCLILLQTSKRKFIRIASFLMSLVLFVITYSLNSWIALLTVFFLFIIRVKRIFYTPLLFFIVSLFFSYFIYDNSPIFLSSQSSLERVYLLKHTTTLLNNNLYFGVGFGNYIYTLINNFNFVTTGVFLQPVHNAYMLMLSELGIFTFAICIAFIVNFIKRVERSRYVSLILMFVFVTFLFDHYWLTIHQNQLLLTILFGLWTKQINAKI